MSSGTMLDSFTTPRIKTLGQVEADYIAHTIERCDRDLTTAAKLLGVSRMYLWRRGFRSRKPKALTPAPDVAAEPESGQPEGAS